MAEWDTPIIADFPADFPAELTVERPIEPGPERTAWLAAIQAAVSAAVRPTLPVRAGGLSCDYQVVSGTLGTDRVVLNLQRQGEPHAD